jgi:two-component system nitrate/nitrite response regulator NarL
MSSTRVVLCDDEEMVLEALATAMEALGVVVVGATVDPVVALALVRLYQPDVCVLDAHFPDGSGPETAAMMRAEAPGTSIVMLTADADPGVWAAYDNQLLSGIINKTLDCETLHSTIEALSRGERVVAGWNRIPRHPLAPSHLETLTERECDVLDALVRGETTDGIALQLTISTHTVRTHIQNLLRKLNVSTRAKATQVALDRGLVRAS